MKQKRNAIMIKNLKRRLRVKKSLDKVLMPNLMARNNFWTFFKHKSVASTSHSWPLLRARDWLPKINPSSSLGIALEDIALRHGKGNGNNSFSNSFLESENDEVSKIVLTILVTLLV